MDYWQQAELQKHALTTGQYEIQRAIAAAIQKHYGQPIDPPPPTISEARWAAMVAFIYSKGAPL